MKKEVKKTYCWDVYPDSFLNFSSKRLIRIKASSYREAKEKIEKKYRSTLKIYLGCNN